MKVQQQLQKLKNGVFRFQEQLMDVRPSPDGEHTKREHRPFTTKLLFNEAHVSVSVEFQ